MTLFEVGKFYYVQIYPHYGVGVHKTKCLCTRLTKTKICFKYISRKYGTNEPYFLTLERRKRMYDTEIECCYSAERFSGISITKANEVCDKPKIWDKVEQKEKEKAK